MYKFGVRMLKGQFFPLYIAENVEVHHDDLVLIRTEKGEEVAKIFKIPCCIAKKWEGKAPEAVPLIRVLTEEDKKTVKEIEEENKEAYKKCLELLEKHNLNMQLVDASFTFDRRKVTFIYTAPARVDFRELLKDLTQTFKRVRIDLRHIGVRDETAIVKGTGLCGKEFCCSTFLRDFESINIKLAKDQGMPINPGKISGTCGRLLCCLNYEYKNYIDAAVGMPPIGSGVMSPEGIGRVCSLHFLNGKVAVKLEDGKIKEFAKNEIEMIDQDVENIDIDLPVAYNQQDEEFEGDISQLED